MVNRMEMLCCKKGLGSESKVGRRAKWRKSKLVDSLACPEALSGRMKICADVRFIWQLVT